MVYFHSSISLCKPFDDLPPIMENSVNSPSDVGSKRIPNSPNTPQITSCDRTPWTVLEVVFCIGVIIGACLYLFIPFTLYFILIFLKISWAILCAMNEEISVPPSIFIALGLCICVSALAIWGIVACTSRKCGNSDCKGLRNSAEFDIQIETEERVKNEEQGVICKGLFRNPRRRDHYRELEAELRKIAPINGRAVLVLRARCGCCVGRLEVPGPKNKTRKTKK